MATRRPLVNVSGEFKELPVGDAAIVAPYPDIITLDPAVLKRYYRLNETSGTVATDSSGNAQDGTYYQGTTAQFLTSATGLIPGDPDKAISFDGVNDNIDVPLASGDFPTSALWAIEAVVQLPTTSEKGAFLSMANGVRRFAIGVGNGDLDTSGNKLTSLVSNIAFRDTGAVLGTGKFHVAAVWIPNIFHIFLNGRLVDTWSSPGDSNLGYGAVIGAEASAASFGRAVKATIDEAAFYTFASIVTPPPATFLEAWWYRRALRALKGI